MFWSLISYFVKREDYILFCASSNLKSNLRNYLMTWRHYFSILVWIHSNSKVSFCFRHLSYSDSISNTIGNLERCSLRSVHVLYSRKTDLARKFWPLLGMRVFFRVNFNLKTSKVSSYLGNQLCDYVRIPYCVHPRSITCISRLSVNPRIFSKAFLTILVT